MGMWQASDSFLTKEFHALRPTGHEVTDPSLNDKCELNLRLSCFVIFCHHYSINFKLSNLSSSHCRSAVDVVVVSMFFVVAVKWRVAL